MKMAISTSRRALLALPLFTAMLLLGCGGPSRPPATPTPEASDEARLIASDDAHLIALAREGVRALRDRDLGALAAMVSPAEGVRFSPYAHVNPTTDLRFFPDDLPALSSPVKYEWGAYDGTGEPIVLTFAEYLERFVYARDFASAPDVSIDERRVQGSNTIFNALEVYEGARFVEFHVPGTEEYAGMDWRSLALIFVSEAGEWKLVGVASDQWTT